MALDLVLVLRELAAAALPPAYPAPLAAAIVSDCFRLAERNPPPASQWHAWSRRASINWEDQLGFLAHVLSTTSLREETLAALAAAPPVASLNAFFERVAPLSGEMLRTNTFRKEEFLRRWAEWLGGSIAGEGAKESARRVEHLDYRKTLAEYKRADKARKGEAERRARLLAEAAKAAADARGWRE
jgi:hypothetical protein